MTNKPRNSKRPKAMQAKPRVTTEATKHKLPRPRKRPATLSDAALDAIHGYTRAVRLSTPPRVQCPRCEKWVPDHPHDIHTCYDAKALREELTPSPIAGQPLDGIGSRPAPEVRAIPCGEDLLPNVPWTRETITLTGYCEPVHVPPPDTSAYPWPIKAANWLDDRIVAAQRGLSRALSRLAVAIKRLAWKVAP